MATYVFVSNYYNHHQSSFSDAMYRETGGNYYFIETVPLEEERKNMGWGMAQYPSYVQRMYENESVREKCRKLIDTADVVIIGSAPDQLIRTRLKQKKLTFRYSERIFKQGCKRYELPARTILHYFRHGRYPSLYMLCASAYTAADYAKTLSFRHKCYKWGYFPEVRRYDDIHLVIQRKKPDSLLWAGRFIDLKHPEMAIDVAKRLKQDDVHFELNLIGNGEMEEALKTMIADNDLSNCVHMLGSMAPDQVRDYMERSEIFMFTSDFNEGWGAVLNEAMNSGCAVVASHAIGSVPFLLEDGENGHIFESGNQNDLDNKVEFLLTHSMKRQRLEETAYETIAGNWNAAIAAERLLTLISEIKQNGYCRRYDTGPCSEADILKDDWYKMQI